MKMHRFGYILGAVALVACGGQTVANGSGTGSGAPSGSGSGMTSGSGSGSGPDSGPSYPPMDAGAFGDAGVDAGHAFIDAGGKLCEVYNNTCVMCADGDWHCGGEELEPCPAGTIAGSSCAPPNEPTTSAGCLVCNSNGSAVQFKCGDQVWQAPPLPAPMTCAE
jgi:hypothetical protein